MMTNRIQYINRRLLELAFIAENRELEITKQEERRLINELETNYGGE